MFTSRDGLFLVGELDIRGLREPRALAEVVADRVRLLPHHALGGVDEVLLTSAVLADTAALTAIRRIDDPVVDAVRLLPARRPFGRSGPFHDANPSLPGGTGSLRVRPTIPLC